MENFFSKIKLVKTRLPNEVKQASVEDFLFIAVESPKDFISETFFEYFVK